MTKEVPLFVRYLKLVTDKEGRQDAFKAFFAKCKDGLSVRFFVFQAVLGLTTWEVENDVLSQFQP